MAERFFEKQKINVDRDKQKSSQIETDPLIRTDKNPVSGDQFTELIQGYHQTK
jgi:hypothetical protein